MTKKCPQDGGFIGDAGCTHPNHQHSKLVKSLLGAAQPRAIQHDISPEDFDAAVSEGFYVTGKDGNRIGFGNALLRHFNEDSDPNSADIINRKSKLIYAINTVTHPDRVEQNHKGLEGRTAYTSSYGDFGILAITDKGGKNIEYIFNIIPKRSLKRKP